MTSLSQELTIEGSMNCSEDDSDECDSEDSTESGIDHLASMRSNQSQDKDDEDEELEYFGKILFLKLCAASYRDIIKCVGATGRKALLFPKKTATIPTIPDPTDFGENHTAIVKG